MELADTDESSGSRSGAGRQVPRGRNVNLRTNHGPRRRQGRLRAGPSPQAIRAPSIRRRAIRSRRAASRGRSSWYKPTTGGPPRGRLLAFFPSPAETAGVIAAFSLKKPTLLEFRAPTGAVRHGQSRDPRPAMMWVIPRNRHARRARPPAQHAGALRLRRARRSSATRSASPRR